MRARTFLRIALVLALSGARVAAAEPRPAADPPPPADVFVTVDSDDPAVRLERVGGGGKPTAICAPPCGLRLERDALYRISGDGVRATPPFRVPGTGSSTTLSVRAGSSLRYRAGVGAAIAGGVVAATSLGYLFASSGDPVANGSERDHGRVLETSLLVLLAGGALAFLGAFLVTSSHTRIDVSEP